MAFKQLNYTLKFKFLNLTFDLELGNCQKYSKNICFFGLPYKKSRPQFYKILNAF